MFYHGFDNYMEHAFPLDELKPLTCGGRTKDDDPDNWAINDVLGNYSVTLVDSLDMFAILGDKTEFEKAVRLTIDNVSFDLDSRVQVFESTIRMLGGLLSGHLIASDDRFGFKISDYKGELLEKARDLGDRLMPAFETPDGIPFPRVNLRQGVLSYEIPSACSAGAGTLLLEFGILTRLTGDKKYERAAKRAMLAVWDRRSSLDLVGNTMSLFKKEWIDKNAGLGAGVDSFYEYLLKSHILFGDREYLDMFQTSYKSILKNVRYSDGFIYKNVDMFTGNLLVTWIDSLAAFFPGLQVLGGDVINAVRPHHLYYTIWKRYKALPERFDFRTKTPSLVYYPLRPELIESTYMLYQATRDPFYLQVGEQLLEDIEERTRVKCGFASIGNVETGKLEDRMESFFLSETLKYLYLLFDEENPFSTRDTNLVFNTEGHLLFLDSKHLNLNSYRGNGTCTKWYQPTQPVFEISPVLDDSLVTYCDELVGLEKPVLIEEQDYTIPNHGIKHPAVVFEDRILISNLHGFKLSTAVKKDKISVVALDDALPVRSHQTIYVMRDGILFHGHSNPPQPQYPPMSAVFQDSQEFHELSMARFGAFMPHGSILKSSLFLVMKEWSFFASTWNLLLEGCQLSDYSRLARDQMCAVKRGTCTFLQKAILAQSSGCSGLIVLSKSKDSLSMTSAIKSNDPIEIPLFYATLEGSLALLKRNKQPITLLAVEQELMNPTLFASTSMAFQGLVVKNVQFVTRTTQDQKRDSNHYKTGWMHTGQRLECFQQSFSKNRCC